MTLFSQATCWSTSHGKKRSKHSSRCSALKPDGRLLLIQPNFRLSFRHYFDDYTHIQIFTDTGLRDLSTSSGFVCKKVVGRFLPFSLKSPGPKWPWLLRLYLALPVRPFAGQMYIVAQPESVRR